MHKQYTIRKNGRTYFKTCDEIKMEIKAIYLRNGKYLDDITLDWITSLLIYVIDDSIQEETKHRYIM